MSDLLQRGDGDRHPCAFYLTCLYVYARGFGVVSSGASIFEHPVGSRAGPLLQETVHREEMHRDRGATAR